MPTINVPHGTFQRLAEMAAALNVTVDELVLPTLESLAQNGAVEAQEPTLPLTGEAWLREIEAWRREAERLASGLPPGHVIDDSRESNYREREDSQF